jgi:hypothetical protein
VADVVALVVGVSREYRVSQIQHQLLVLGGLVVLLGGGTALCILLGRFGNRLPRQIELWVLLVALVAGGVGYAAVGLVAVMVVLALTAAVLAAALLA